MLYAKVSFLPVFIISFVAFVISYIAFWPAQSAIKKEKKRIVIDFIPIYQICSSGFVSILIIFQLTIFLLLFTQFLKQPQIILGLLVFIFILGIHKILTKLK